MANIIAQIIITLNLLLGHGNFAAPASQNFNQGGYTNNGGGHTINGGGHCNGGIVIIDTDEL